MEDDVNELESLTAALNDFRRDQKPQNHISVSTRKFPEPSVNPIFSSWKKLMSHLLWNGWKNGSTSTRAGSPRPDPWCLCRWNRRCSCSNHRGMLLERLNELRCRQRYSRKALSEDRLVIKWGGSEVSGVSVHVVERGARNDCREDSCGFGDDYGSVKSIFQKVSGCVSIR